MRNYEAVVNVLLEECRDAGYELVSIRDEEGSTTVHDSMPSSDITRIATDTETCALVFKHEYLEPHVFGHKIVFFLVYGNALDETICDHTDCGAADSIANVVADKFAGCV